MNDLRARATAATMILGAASVSLLLAFAASAPVHAADAFKAVPAQFHGTWVATSAACDSPLKLQVSVDKVTLTNGADSHTLEGIEMAGPGYFPPGYRGIMAVLITEFSGRQPAIATFNPDEKKGAARLEYASTMLGPGRQLRAHNEYISKLNLAKRFPLDKVMLKKCP